MSGFSYPAMILAAGLGKRMREYAPDIPKPLVPVAGRPLIDYSFMLLGNAGIDAAVVNSHYRADQLEAYLHRQRDLRLEISREEELLETGGGVCKALPLLAERFFVLNSDVICEDVSPPILQQMQQAWDEARMDALLLVIPVARAMGYRGAGDFSFEPDSGFGSQDSGKALPLQNRADDKQEAYVFTGVQLLHRRFLKNAPEGAFSLSLFYKRALKEQPCRLYGLAHPGRWFHVGDGEGVGAAEQLL